MSDQNNSLQGIFGQVLREIQTGLNRLEQTVNQAAQQAQQQGGQPGGFPPVDQQPPVAPAQPEQYSQPQPSAPKAPAEPYNGQRYEYKVVYVNFRGQISSEGEQAVIGRGERRSSFVREYLDELGQQGWELTGVSPLGETENSYFIFKRPTSKDRPATSTTSASRGGQRVRVEEVDENTVAEL